MACKHSLSEQNRAGHGDCCTCIAEQLKEAQDAILEQQKLCDKHQRDASERAQRAEAQAQKDREKCAVLERERMEMRKEANHLKEIVAAFRSGVEGITGGYIADGAVFRTLVELRNRINNLEKRARSALHMGRKLVFVRRYSEGARNACIAFDKEYRGTWTPQEWDAWVRSKKTDRDAGGLG